MRFVIIGAGAIGGSIAGLMHAAGQEATLVARGAHGEAIRAHGLCVRTPERDIVARCACHETVRTVNWRKDDVAVVATKLNDARQMLDELLEVVGSSLPVAMATNGIDGEAWAAARFDTALAMMVWTPASHLIPGEVCIHAHEPRGVIDVGAATTPATPVPAALSEQLARAGFESTTRADIARWKLAKLYTNTGNTAQALITDDWKRVARAAKDEARRALASLDPIAEETLAARVASTKPGEVEGVPRGGGSTWQSLQRGRPLETPWIEGAIVRLAEQGGLTAPVCSRLTEAARGPTFYTADRILAERNTAFS